jgi:type I site-specific restriction-modification system R (restriction) subunit
VLVTECKNATKDEGIALGIDQIRRYHEETPELFVPQQLFTATDAIGFSYGVTWNTVRRSIFVWKIDEPQRTQGAQREEGDAVLKSKSSAISAFSAVRKRSSRLGD